jgi:hypothetical protein
MRVCRNVENSLHLTNILTKLSLPLFGLNDEEEKPESRLEKDTKIFYI